MIPTILSNKANGSNTMRGLFKKFEYHFNMISQIKIIRADLSSRYYKTIIYIQ